MSSIYIAAIIVIALVVLVCYAFVSQSLEQKRKQKQRLMTALKTRLRDFKYMLKGFPADFLPKELVILVHRCLIDVYEQLAHIEPKEPLYKEELNLYSKQMQEALQKPNTAKAKPLQNIQQIKEVRQHLKELNTFVAHLEQRGTLTTNQADIHRQQIKQLIIQISVDAYILHAKDAQQNNKARLALHYYNLASKLLARENADGAYQKQLANLSAITAQIEAKLADEEPDHKESEEQKAEKDAVTQAWENFAEGDKSWKKKHLYD